MRPSGHSLSRPCVPLRFAFLSMDFDKKGKLCVFLSIFQAGAVAKKALQETEERLAALTVQFQDASARADHETKQGMQAKQQLDMYMASKVIHCSHQKLQV
jgi:hypothetical protein